MSQSVPQPRFDMRGAVDLSSLGRPATPPPGSTSDGGASGVVVDVTDEGFADLVQRSTQVPVVLSMWAERDPRSSAVTATLAAIAPRLGGRLLVGRVDVERAPGAARAIGEQAGSTVVAVVQGQAVPLPPLEGATEEQVAAVLDQVLQMAAANGVTGRVDVGEEAPAEPEEPPLPPLHQAAYDAIDRGDLDAAVSAYERALAENPRDDMARAGLAQVTLLRRTAGIDVASVREAAADPRDVDAQLGVADLDVLGGQVEDAFARLVDTVRATSGDERERVRVRLIELFAVVGDTDPRVMAARRALASALY